MTRPAQPCHEPSTAVGGRWMMMNGVHGIREVGAVEPVGHWTVPPQQGKCLHFPSETISTVSSTTLMAVSSSIA